MWTRIASALVVLFLSAPAFRAAASDEVALMTAGLAAERLSLAEGAFERGRFSDAAIEVDSLLATEDDLAEPERARAFLLKSRLSLAFERRDEMYFWLERLAALEGHAAPDAMRDPPELMQAWERARVRRAAQKAPPPSPVPAPEPSPLGRFEGDLRREARFWVGLIPFGVGHFTNGLVWEGFAYSASESSLVLLTSGLVESARLEAESLSGPWDSRVGDEMAFDADRERALSLLGFMGFMGLWGYELHSLTPELMRANPAGARATRFALSFAPFGAAQIKNGEGLKAVGFAAAELSFLILSASLPRESQRSWASFFLFGSFVGGAIDGWINHDWNRTVTEREVWRVGLGMSRGIPVVKLSVDLGP